MDKAGFIWDGHNEHVEALVDGLAELTGLGDLSWHTLLPLKELLLVETCGVLCSVYGKRWCASCVARWRRKGMEPWEPLLWRISFVRCCPIHSSVLSRVCGTCKKPQGLVSDRVPFGFCRECGRHVEIGDPLILKRRARTPAVGEMGMGIVAGGREYVGFSESAGGICKWSWFCAFAE